MVESPKQGDSPQGLGRRQYAGLCIAQKSAVAAKRNHPPLYISESCLFENGYFYTAF